MPTLPSSQQFKNLTKRKPLWRDLTSFGLLVVGLWGSSHAIMNYSAYSEIFAFQYRSLKASVIQDISTKQQNLSHSDKNLEIQNLNKKKQDSEPKTLEKTQAKKNIGQQDSPLRKQRKRSTKKEKPANLLSKAKAQQKKERENLAMRSTAQEATKKLQVQLENIKAQSLQAQLFAIAEDKTMKPKNESAPPEKQISKIAPQIASGEDLAIEAPITSQEVEKTENKLPLSNETETRTVETPEDQIIFRDETLSPNNQAKKTLEKMDIYPSDNRIIIPSINKNVPLINVPNHKNWRQLETNIQKGLQNGVVVHPVSHMPGSFGNFFVTGHSSYYAWDKGRFKDVFALLHEMEVGEIVEIYWEGKKYTYKIQQKEVVAPTAVEILDQPKDHKKITLMTCTPIGTNKNRLVLVGELLEEE